MPHRPFERRSIICGPYSEIVDTVHGWAGPASPEGTMANSVVRAPPEFELPVFLSTAPAERRDRRLALVAVFLSLLIFVAAAPFARLPLPQMWAFIPIYESALTFSDLITAVLLFAQFSILRSRALLVLACGYLFTALITAAHMLTFPGLFSPTGMFGAGPQSTAWLYMFWHGVFPITVIAYALVKGGTRAIGLPHTSAGLAFLVSIVSVVAAVVTLTSFATIGHTLLPSIMRGNNYTPVMIFVVSTVWILSAVAVLVLWVRRPHTVLDLWLMVVMCAWFFDVALSAVFNTGRFDLGFYVGRIYGLLAATFVLLVLLFETGALYARLARLLATEQRERKREMEGRHLIFETSLDLILIVDRQGKFLQVSPSSEAILGYRPEEMTGHIGIEFIYPDDLERTQNEMRMARRGQEMRYFECRYLHKDGRVVSLAWSGVWAEQQQFFIGRDMTERKRLEEAERSTKEMIIAVIDASPVAIVCLAIDRSVMIWSRAAEQIFGYTAEETVGQPYPLVPLGQEAEYDDLIKRALAGETLRDVRVQRHRKDGSLVDIIFDAAAVYDSNGVRCVVYALVDITERNKLEKQLRQSHKMDAIGQLTGGVAHDFNNMLTVITGTIDILADAVADKPQLAAVAKLISDAADRGAELTGHLLAFARKQPLQPRETDVNALMIEAAKLLHPTLGEHIEIETILKDDVWSALVDPSQLGSALLNLAINARDAMPNGGKLTLETSNVVLDQGYAKVNGDVQPGNYVLIAVSDTGAGIPEAIRDKVFEPFFTTKEVGKGTGLGLSMVYGFVKQSGGHIKIYSEEGHGTAFKLYLPKAGAQSEQIAETALVSQIEGGTETILIVEDDALVRTFATTQLQSLGYKTLSAANAAEALAIADSGATFDLLFTDVIIPGQMNGRQLAEVMAKRRSPLKVLFTSGYTENAIIHHGRLDPGVLLLAKPYRKQDLARMLRRAIQTAETLPARIDERSKSQAI